MCKDVGERGGGLRRERKEGMDEWKGMMMQGRWKEEEKGRDGREKAIDGKV